MHDHDVVDTAGTTGTEMIILSRWVRVSMLVRAASAVQASLHHNSLQESSEALACILVGDLIEEDASGHAGMCSGMSGT